MPGGGGGDQEHSASVLSDQDADNWIQCDRCNKWRRVPKQVSDAIDDDAEWYVVVAIAMGRSLRMLDADISLCRYCENNPNRAFASCHVPQELTNEEIDQEAQEVRVRGMSACKLTKMHFLIKQQHGLKLSIP
jgi:hypothetical protein